MAIKFCRAPVTVVASICDAYCGSKLIINAEHSLSVDVNHL